MNIGQEVFYYDSKNYIILSGTVSAISNTEITIKRSEHTYKIIDKNHVYETRAQAEGAKKPSHFRNSHGKAQSYESH